MDDGYKTKNQFWKDVYQNAVVAKGKASLLPWLRCSATPARVLHISHWATSALLVEYNMTYNAMQASLGM